MLEHGNAEFIDIKEEMPQFVAVVADGIPVYVHPSAYNVIVGKALKWECPPVALLSGNRPFSMFCFSFCLKSFSIHPVRYYHNNLYYANVK